MRVAIERGLVHRCPHVAEWDHGTVIASWEGDTVELHDLAKHLDGYEGRALTHEAVTEFIALHLRATGAQRPRPPSSLGRSERGDDLRCPLPALSDPAATQS